MGASIGDRKAAIGASSIAPMSQPWLIAALPSPIPPLLPRPALASGRLAATRASPVSSALDRRTSATGSITSTVLSQSLTAPSTYDAPSAAMAMRIASHAAASPSAASGTLGEIHATDMPLWGTPEPAAVPDGAAAALRSAGERAAGAAPCR